LFGLMKLWIWLFDAHWPPRSPTPQIDLFVDVLTCKSLF
jgi:hypothetical protein